MSNDGSDPFGRSDRTFIRPNPAGRRVPPPSRPAQGQPYPPPNAPYAPPAGYPPQGSPYGPSGSPQYPHGAPSPGVPGGDEWMATPQPQPRPSAPPPPPQGYVPQPLPKREQMLTPNTNALLKAAGPLLLLLGRLRANLSSAPATQMIGQVGETIEAFDHEVRAAGFTAEQTRTAKYIICAFADDIVQNIPGEDRHVWTQYSMLSRFFGERIGGVRFFEELERAKRDPGVNYDLLELMHVCLALGFEGVHRTSAGGAANLQMIQRSLFETLRRVKQPIRNCRRAGRARRSPRASPASRCRSGRSPPWRLSPCSASISSSAPCSAAMPKPRPARCSRSTPRATSRSSAGSQQGRRRPCRRRHSRPRSAARCSRRSPAR